MLTRDFGKDATEQRELANQLVDVETEADSRHAVFARDLLPRGDTVSLERTRIAIQCFGKEREVLVNAVTKRCRIDMTRLQLPLYSIEPASGLIDCW